MTSSTDQMGRRRASVRAHAVLTCALVLLLGCGSGGESADRPGDIEGDITGVHDPSAIVRDGGEYFVLSTGGPRILSSPDLHTWRDRGALFPRPAWVAAEVANASADLWAPAVRRLNGLFHLYYSASSFGSNDSCIGLATSAALDPDDPAYGWTDRGPILCSERASRFNAIDPDVVVDAGGRWWLVFGSFWTAIKLVELDRASGTPIPGAPLYDLAARREPFLGIPDLYAIEAASIVRRGGFYYLFVNWDLCCRGVESTYNVRVGRATQITGPYIDRDGVPMIEGGGTLLLGSIGRFIGPGHAGVFQRSGGDLLGFHYYDAENGGTPTFALRALTWPGGWPYVAGNAE